MANIARELIQLRPHKNYADVFLICLFGYFNAFVSGNCSYRAHPHPRQK